jgi:O-antigen ligase
MAGSLSMNKRLFFILAFIAVFLGLGTFLLVPIVSKNIFLVLAIPFACLFLIIMVTRPKWALASLLAVRSVLDLMLVHTNVELSGSDAGIGAILNLLIMGLAVLLIYPHVSQLPKWLPLIRFWLIFLAVCVISIVFSPDAIRAFKSTVQQVPCLLIFLVPFFIVRDEKDKKFWLNLLIYSSLLPVGVANFGLVSRMRMFYTDTFDAGMRLQGSFTHPNILAFYIVLILVVIFYAFKTRSIVFSAAQKILVVPYVLNLLLILLATKTRSALIAFWLVLFIYGILKEKKYLFIVLLLTGALMMTPQVQERMSGLFSKSPSRLESNKNSFAWRMRLWGASMPLIKDRPVFGRGLGSFRIMAPEFFGGPRSGTLSHNVYVQLLFETGLVGLVGYLGFFLNLMFIFYAKIRDKTKELSVASAILFSYLIGYLVVCYSDNVLEYVTFNWYYFFFLGLAASSLYLPGKTKSQDP